MARRGRTGELKFRHGNDGAMRYGVPDPVDWVASTVSAFTRHPPECECLRCAVLSLRLWITRAVDAPPLMQQISGQEELELEDAFLRSKHQE